MPAEQETLLGAGGWQAHDLIRWLLEEEKKLEREWWDALRDVVKYLHRPGYEQDLEVVRTLLELACRSLETHRQIMALSAKTLRHRLWREYRAYMDGMNPYFDHAKRWGDGR